MTILHICTGYCDTNLYFNFVKELDKKGVRQIMYVPLKKGKSCKNQSELKDEYYKLKKFQIIYAPIMSIDLRIRYFSKINRIFKDIEAKIDLTLIDVVHAHFLYTDGGVAYKIKQKYNIPYITAIRNTDVNTYYKYFIHCRYFAKKVLFESKKIIFISPAYKSFLNAKAFKKISNVAHKKSVIIPNGIDEFWLKQEKIPIARELKGIVKFVFVGDLSKNKNIHGTISLLKAFKDKTGTNIDFTIIGPKSNYSDEILELVNKNSWVNYLGPIYDKQVLKEIFLESSIFIMLSKKETFGLVYIEAMSQGLPIIYTKGQGIDGFFEENKVGLGINLKNSNNEISLINDIIINYEKITFNCIECSKSFNWETISKNYLSIYKVLCNTLSEFTDNKVNQRN